jgi:ribosome-associated protein
MPTKKNEKTVKSVKKVVAKKVVAKAPAKTAAKKVAVKPVTKSTTKKVVTKPAVKKAVTKPVAKKVVAKAPAKTAAKKVVAKKVVAKAPAKTAVKKSAKKTVIKNATLDLVLHFLDKGKAENIVSLPIGEKTSFADYMVIATSNSSRHLNALAKTLEDELKKAKVPCHIEASMASEWVLVDTGLIIVNLMTTEMRDYYQLEELWK